MVLQNRTQTSSYSTEQVTNWLESLNLPQTFHRYTQCPEKFPKTAESLRILMRCQITTFPYENLSVHYSPTHLVDICPEALYEKMMGPDNRKRGGYCMELSIFFHHMLRGLGFFVYMTGVRNRARTNGIPSGEYQGWTHIVNIVHLPLGEKFALDVAFGGDGPITPLLLEGSRTAVPNIGPQQVRLIQDTIPKQQLETTKLWIYQYRNGPDREWNSFYSFAELEFFQEDFEVMNWFASARTLHRWTVLVVRFLREADCSLFSERGEWGLSTADVGIVGKVMLVNDVVKVNLGGKTEIVRSFDSEKGRLQALKEYFGIELTSDQQQGILGWDMRLTN